MIAAAKGPAGGATDAEHPVHQGAHLPAHAAARHRHGPGRRLVLSGRTVVTHGLRRQVLQDLYHQFMTVSWPALFAAFGAFYVAFNLLFAALYWLAPGGVANLYPDGFWGDFFFSVETLATVGYGDMHPQSVYAHVVASIEIFVGVILVAMMTGAMFARFSRPRARILFARYGVVRPLDGQTTLMFRAANARQNVIVEASAQLRMLCDATTSEGWQYRRIVDLPLVRSQHPSFVLGWNLMHVIDEHSPLAGQSAASLEQIRAVFMLNLSGTDETTGQVVMSRHQYASESIRWNHGFRDILHATADGVYHLNYDHFDVVDPIEEPTGARA